MRNIWPTAEETSSGQKMTLGAENDTGQIMTPRNKTLGAENDTRGKK